MNEFSDLKVDVELVHDFDHLFPVFDAGICCDSLESEGPNLFLGVAEELQNTIEDLVRIEFVGVLRGQETLYQKIQKLLTNMPV